MIYTNKKEELYHVAARLFREKGYYNTSMRDIAKHSNLSKGTIYYYINSKEDLLSEIVMFSGDMVLGKVGEVFSSSLSYEEKFINAVTVHMKCFDTNQDEVSVFLREISNLPPKVQAKCNNIVKQYKTLWENFMHSGIQNGFFCDDLDVPITVHSVLSLCNWTYNWYKQGGRLRIEDISSIYCRIMLYGIRRREK